MEETPLMKYTSQQIVEMEAGMTIDALIAEHLMDKPFKPPTHGSCCTCQRCGRAHEDCNGYCEYSSSLGHGVWEMFKAALLLCGNAAIFADMEDYGRGAIFGSGPEQVVAVTVGEHMVVDTMPIALCKAALLQITDLYRDRQAMATSSASTVSAAVESSS